MPSSNFASFPGNQKLFPATASATMPGTVLNITVYKAIYTIYVSIATNGKIGRK